MNKEALTLIFPQQNPFRTILSDPLTGRSEKPRKTGVTMVIDKGLGLCGLTDLLELAATHFDFLKLGFGTSLLYPQDVLEKKLNLAKLYGVYTCAGGTLGEIALLQNQFEYYVQMCHKLGFTAVEVSDGTIDVDAATRRRAIARASKDCIVLSEIGKKLSAFPSSADAAKQVENDLDAGASYVIIEGRESGVNVGIYGSEGDIEQDRLAELLALLPKATLPHLLWEAPRKNQQIALMETFGVDVNLGNIHPQDVLAVESLRRGLRSDTLFKVSGTGTQIGQ